MTRSQQAVQNRCAGVEPGGAEFSELVDGTTNCCGSPATSSQNIAWRQRCTTRAATRSDGSLHGSGVRVLAAGSDPIVQLMFEHRSGTAPSAKMVSLNQRWSNWRRASTPHRRAFAYGHFAEFVSQGLAGPTDVAIDLRGHFVIRQRGMARQVVDGCAGPMHVMNAGVDDQARRAPHL